MKTVNSKYGKFISTLFLLMAVILVIACGKSGEKTTVSTTATASAHQVKTYTITGRVTQTAAYCGGAPPPQQVLDQLATPVAYPGKKFYIRKGQVNDPGAGIVQGFTTGADGEFSIELSTGTYSLIVEEQRKNIKATDLEKEFQQVDKQCLLEWWIKPLYVLQVKDKNISGLSFNFHHRCFISGDIPCITYNGPMPP